MTWSFLLVFSVIRTKNCSVHCSYQPKNSISTCSLGGKKFHNIPVISLGVRKISWKKKLPFHIIKCFSFKEVPLQEKFLFVPSHLMSYCLWGFLHSVSCFFFFSIYAENTIFKKEKRNQANNNTNEFWKEQTKYKQVPPFLPAWAFNFRNAFYLWFFICKEDLWGQIVQIFYFSHHWTNKTTDSHFINMLEKKKKTLSFLLILFS